MSAAEVELSVVERDIGIMRHSLRKLVRVLHAARYDRVLINQPSGFGGFRRRKRGRVGHLL